MKRISLNLSTRATESLTALQESSGMNQTAVINRALNLLAMVQARVDDDWQLAFVKDDTLQRVEIL